MPVDTPRRLWYAGVIMPSLVEEDPEYPSKVAAYEAVHGKIPWGFILANGHLVAVTTSRERREHLLALAGQLVVAESDEADVPGRAEPVAGKQTGESAATAGVEAADAGVVVPALVVPARDL